MSELIFPPDEQSAADQRPLAYEVGPQTLPYFTDNGLTYTYDPTKNAWVLKTGVAVTQDQLEIEMKRKLDKTGGTIIGTDNGITFSETIYSSTPDRIAIRVDGRIFMNSDNKKFIFNDTSTMGPAGFYVDGTTDSDRYLEFASSGLVSYKKLNFASTSSNTLISHTHTGGSDVVLADLNSNSSFSGKNIVKLSNKSSLQIRGANTTIVDISATGSGGISITPLTNGLQTFVINQRSHPTEVFRVDTDTHKLYTSMDYNEGLKAGNTGAIVTGTSGTIAFTDENLVATVGFVQQGFFRPGMNVFAGSEDAAEVGGLWTDGFNYFIKVEE